MMLILFKSHNHRSSDLMFIEVFWVQYPDTVCQSKGIVVRSYRRCCAEIKDTKLWHGKVF